MGFQPQLASKWIFTATFSAGYFDKLGHIGLVFGKQSGWISGSVHARLQVCVLQLRFAPPWLTCRADRHTHPHRQTDCWHAYMEIPGAELKTHILSIIIDICQNLNTIILIKRTLYDSLSSHQSHCYIQQLKHVKTGVYVSCQWKQLKNEQNTLMYCRLTKLYIYCS